MATICLNMQLKTLVKAKHMILAQREVIFSTTFGVIQNHPPFNPILEVGCISLILRQVLVVRALHRVLSSIWGRPKAFKSYQPGFYGSFYPWPFSITKFSRIHMFSSEQPKKQNWKTMCHPYEIRLFHKCWYVAFSRDSSQLSDFTNKWLLSCVGLNWQSRNCLKTSIYDNGLTAVTGYCWKLLLIAWYICFVITST